MNHAKPTPGQQVHNEYQVRIARHALSATTQKNQKDMAQGYYGILEWQGNVYSTFTQDRQKKAGITMAPVRRMAITTSHFVTITIASCISQRRTPLRIR